jgi:translocator protein
MKPKKSVKKLPMKKHIPRTGASGLLLSAVVCIVLGSIGALAMGQASKVWYGSVQKPFFTPPDWLFAPVWLVLYGIMGMSAYLIYKSGKENEAVREALTVFWVQLGLNILWSYLFFGLRSPLMGLIGIVSLWIAILGMILMFSRLNRLAAIINIPYLIWVSFALVLTVSIYTLNP